MKRFLLIFSILLTVLPSFGAGEVAMQVVYPNGQNFAYEDDVIYLNIITLNVNSDMSQPKNVPGCNVIGFQRTAYSQQTTIINGKRTSSQSGKYIVALQPKQTGTFDYAVTVGHAKSNTVKIVIKSGKSPNPTHQSPYPATGYQPTPTLQPTPTPGSNANADIEDVGQGDSNLFMRVQVSKTSCFEQEAIVYTLKLYSTYPYINFLGAAAAPKFDGFAIESSEVVDDALHPEIYNGKQYGAAVVARYIIFPQSAGKKQVKGNTYTVNVDRRYNSYGFVAPTDVKITAPTVEIDVKPLPSPKPGGFSGGVGTFQFSSTLPSTNFKTHQASNIQFTVSGTGNLRFLNAPNLQALYPESIEVYNPTTKVDVTAGATDVSGKVLYDYSLMPTETGNFTLPGVEFIYFDPSKEEYVTLKSDSYNITVAQGEVSDKSHGNHVEFNKELMSVGDLSKEHTPLVDKSWYWLIYIIATAGLLGAFIICRWRLSRMADEEGMQARRAKRQADKWLKTARKYAAEGNREKFYDSLLEALWGYLGSKLKIKSSVLTRNNVEEILREKGVEDSIINAVINLINNAEFVKYTSLDSDDDMHKIVREAAELIGKVEAGFGKKKRGSTLDINVIDISSLSDKDVKTIRKEINQKQ